MALVTLQTIFQDAFPAYEALHPLPAHVRKAARAIMQCRTAALGAMCKRVQTVTSPASGTTPVGTGPVRNARLSRPSAGWHCNGRGSWRVTIIM